MNKAITSQKQFYNDWDYGQFSKTKAERILAYFPKGNRRKKLLDVACGEGQFYEYLKNKNVDYIGIDFAKKQIKKGKKKGLNLSYGDLTKKWPFKDKSFDIVLASEIIEHIFDTDYFLQEARRVLKKDGVLILTTPNVCYLGARIRCLFGRRPPVIECRAGGGNAGHIRAFSAGDLKLLLNENGFIIEKYVGDDFYLPFGISSNTKIFGRLCDLLSYLFPRLASGLIIKIR